MKKKKCKMCQGTGEIYVCNECDEIELCPACKGSGEIEEEK